MAKKENHTPFDLILETASILFFCAAAFAVVSLLRQNIRTPISLIVATSLPAAAALLLVIAALIVPGVYAVKKLSFPLNITLPLLHGSLIFMLAELTRGSFGLEQPPEPLQPALAWSDVRFLALAVIGQFLVLSLLIGIRGGAVPAPDPQR